MARLARVASLLLTVLAMGACAAPTAAPVETQAPTLDAPTVVPPSTEPPTSESAAPGDFSGLVDIGGGRRLYLECRGSGSPTVILEAGMRTRSDVWIEQADIRATPPMVLPGLSELTRVCAYDRPGTTFGADGLSRSDPVPQPRDPSELSADLAALLAAADLRGPYVLVAHSMGGLVVRHFASQHPDQVAGLVLVDAMPDQLMGLLAPEDQALFAKLAVEKPAALADYEAYETVDLAAFGELVHEAEAARPLGEIPLVVISRDVPMGFGSDVPAGFEAAYDKAWRAGQDQLAALRPDARRVVATKSGHYVQAQEPELVIEATRQVIDAVRDPASWSSPP